MVCFHKENDNLLNFKPDHLDLSLMLVIVWIDLMILVIFYLFKFFN